MSFVHTREDPFELINFLVEPRNPARLAKLKAGFERKPKPEVKKAPKERPPVQVSLWRLARRSENIKLPYVKVYSSLTHELAEHKGEMTLSRIMQEVAHKYKVSIMEIKSARRHYAIVKPRQEFYYRAKLETLNSLPAIGKYCGGRDHTTVLHGVRKYAKDHDLPLPHEQRKDAA